MTSPLHRHGSLHHPRATWRRWIPGAWAGAVLVGLLSVSFLKAGGPVTAGASHTPTAASLDHQAGTSSSCTECHAMDRGLSHPVGVVPSMQIPSAFVLENGKLACTTCHESTDHRGGEKGAMLRKGVSEEGLCSQCHAKQGRSSPHTGNWQRAHLVGAEVGMRASLAKASKGEETRECMSCHDGSVATDAGAHRLAMDRSMGSEDDHPVEISYRSEHRPGLDLDLKPVSRVDPRIRMFGNYVGCGSCHSTYSRNTNLLVIPNTGSQLCMSCHRV